MYIHFSLYIDTHMHVCQWKGHEQVIQGRNMAISRKAQLTT